MLAATGVGVWAAPPGAPFDAPPEQQSQVQGGQVLFAGQAAQAQAQPPVPLPPSAGGLIRMHDPEGQGAVKQAIPSSTQPHESAASAEQEAASVYAVHGSAG